MNGPVAALIGDKSRLHLQHGPIDLIIGADEAAPSERIRAFRAAKARFDTVLAELVTELPDLRRPLQTGGTSPDGAIAQRMYRAVLPHVQKDFVTSMAAVAGAVADEVLSAMMRSAVLRRAYVNNGGDIALHLELGQKFRTAIASLQGQDLGRIAIDSNSPVRGIATSGQGGRSLSFGIADSVTVLAQNAAAADVAATLVANAVTPGDHPEIRRKPACEVQPDSDLGARLVVTSVGALSDRDIALALDNGARAARNMQRQGQITGAYLVLRDQHRVMDGPRNQFSTQIKRVEHA